MSPVNRSGSAAAARGDGGSRKSPLRLATDPVPVISAGSSRTPESIADVGFRRSDLSPAEQRQVMISEYGEWLRSQTNRHGRPFQAETISAYRDAAVALSAWMTSAGLEADFTGCDTAVLNRFFFMGWWQDRAMLDRYGADLQVQRAVEAKRRRGEMY
jgi:hypothetical protein